VRAHKLRVTVPREPDREIAVRLPNDFPAGPAEVIVLADSASAASVVNAPYQPTSAALDELLSFQATPEEQKILEDFEAFGGALFPLFAMPQSGPGKRRSAKR